MRKFTYDVIAFYEINQNQEISSMISISVLIIGLIVSSSLAFLIFYWTLSIYRNKMSILSLYALLKMDEVKQVYLKCKTFLDELKMGLYAL